MIRKKLKRWLWWGAALALAVSARGVEEDVALGGESSASWMAPDAGWDGRVVLILHGFASDGEGPGDAQRRLARALAEKGIASLRVNFAGEGDAERTEILSTFGGRVADTEACRAWVTARAGVAAERIGVLGWSLGGGTAIATAARHPGWFRSLAVWSGVSGDLHAQLTSGEWKAAAEQAEKEGAGSLVIPTWKTVTLRREFFESFRGVDVDAELARYPGAFLSVRGSADYLPAAETKWLAIAKGRPAEAVLIGGGDHIFNVFEPGAPQIRQAIEVTVAWFARTL